MMNNGNENGGGIFSTSKADLLLRVEQIKYRKVGPGKSPTGTLSIYEDRVEWIDPATFPDGTLTIPLAKIQGQKVSDPNKPKVQLQICLYNEDKHTFVFMDPALDRAGLNEQQTLVKETLQQALIRNRQLQNKLDQKATEKAKESEVLRDKKLNLLKSDDRLFDIYKHLVKQGLISAQDFWDAHLREDEDSRLGGKRPPEASSTLSPETSSSTSTGAAGGISAGFLSGIIQPDPTAPNGLTYNLTMDTIQAIFKVFPAVERKHLELVPHELSEQEFWTNFLRSHYIHYRDRSTEATRNPLDDCERLDEQEINNLIDREKRSLKRHLNLNELEEDLGVLSEMRTHRVPIRGHTSKLFRRFNYHSERVLNSSLEAAGPLSQQKIDGAGSGGVEEMEVDEDPARKTKSQKTTFGALESDELALVDAEAEHFAAQLVPLTLRPPATTEKVDGSEVGDTDKGAEVLAERIRMRAFARQVLDATGSIFEHTSMMAFFDGLAGLPLDDSAILGRGSGGDRTDGKDAPYLFDEPDSDDESGGRAMAGSSMRAFERAGVDSPSQIRDIWLVHNRLTELLRHFWLCFPARTVELRQKALRVYDALNTFEHNQLRECEERYGEPALAHCRQMLGKAREKFAREESGLRQDE